MDRSAAINIFNTTIAASMDFRRRRLGEVPMSFFFLMPDDQIVQVPAMPGVAMDDMTNAVRTLSETVGARYVISTGEAWMAKRNTLEGPAPSEAPDRKEVILITIDGPDLQMLAMIEIRPDGTLGEPTIKDKIGGRFTNLSGMVDIN